jgi:hypothetical protein
LKQLQKKYVAEAREEALEEGMKEGMKEGMTSLVCNFIKSQEKRNLDKEKITKLAISNLGITEDIVEKAYKKLEESQE